MTTKHTPGPWGFEYDRFGKISAIVRTGDPPFIPGDSIANAPYPNPKHPDALNFEANAPLLAGGPDLLAALDRLLRWQREPWAGDDSPENESVIDQAEAAIAKATN